MSEPTIVAHEPVVLELEPGEYWWCACGKSKNQPFCDGSHEDTSFLPKQILLTEKKTVALCQCKHTSNPPFCDGTHKHLHTE